MENLALRKVVIGAPKGFRMPRDRDAHINPSQKHRSSFVPSDFSDRGYVIRGQGLELVCGDKGIIRKLPRFLKPIACVLSYFTSPLTYLRLQASLHILFASKI